MENAFMPPTLAKYVTDNIDKAIKSGWIKVYYQPVIRSLTGKLCGAESLARWIDPEMGFLTPDKFIGVLEESRQIHKLDMFMLEQVCADVADRIKKGLPTVTVSVNFSRLDFEEVDMLRTVEDLVEKYDIPRDYLHIEVTESMIVSDAALMTRIIDSFREAGYEVWMDDFGSGYSSLNLLKDYTFDTLKLDMAFLSNFNDKSKAIVTSTITMAKNINMMTLAEGVETTEQAQFLSGIGCEKLQGYLYGKPMPVDEFFPHIQKANIGVEERKWRHFYDVASSCARNTDQPLEVIEDDGKSFRTLFMNDPYKNQIFFRDYTNEQADELIYKTPSPLLKKYREFADQMELSRNVETFYYTYSGNILKFVGQAVAENEGHYIIRAAIYNISMDSALSKRNSLDSRLKELNHLYEQVLQINPSKNTVIPLLGKSTFGIDWSPSTTSLKELYSIVEKELISPADRVRYREFGDFTTLAKRIEESGIGYIETLFRMKQKEGTYRWRVAYFMMIPGTLGEEFMLCIKPVPDYALDILNGDKKLFKYEDFGLTGEELERYTKLFKNFVAYSSIKFFWKDTQKRYVGASQAFLDYFGMDSVEAIKGKTTEELNWALDTRRCIEEEDEVLNHGTFLKNATAQYIINGIIHNTVYSKTPVYEDGNIIGIMGYFVDVGEELDRMDAMYRIDKIDKKSGLMTVRAFLNTMVDYAVERDRSGSDFGLIILRHVNHGRIVGDYGEDFGDRVIKEISDRILSVTGQSCAVGRMRNEDIGLITQVNEQQELELIAKQLKDEIESIKEVDGRGVTIRIKMSCRLRSSEGTTDENLYALTLKDLD